MKKLVLAMVVCAVGVVLLVRGNRDLTKIYTH